MMRIAECGHFKYTYCIAFEIMTCHTQLSKFEIIRIHVVKCVQGQVQHTLSEVKVVVHAEFEDTMSARVCPKQCFESRILILDRFWAPFFGI